MPGVGGVGRERGTRRGPQETHASAVSQLEQPEPTILHEQLQQWQLLPDKSPIK